jgi:ferredoxin
MIDEMIEQLHSEAQEDLLVCRGCGQCISVCPVAHERGITAGGLSRALNSPECIDANERSFVEDCILCGACVSVCCSGSRRDRMTHALKFLSWRPLGGEHAKATHAGDKWLNGIKHDLDVLMSRKRLGRLANLIGREQLSPASHLLWIGRNAIVQPDMTMRLIDLCRQLEPDMEVVVDDRAPSGRSWTIGDSEGAHSAAEEFIHIHSITHAHEIICVEDQDARFFSAVLEDADYGGQHNVKVLLLADWLQQYEARLRLRDGCNRPMWFSASLRNESERRHWPRFRGFDKVRNYAAACMPEVLGCGTTARDSGTLLVKDMANRVLSHLRHEAGYTLIVETLADALRLKEQAKIEGGAQVLYLPEALEIADLSSEPEEAEVIVVEVADSVEQTAEAAIIEEEFDLPAEEEIVVEEVFDPETPQSEPDVESIEELESNSDDSSESTQDVADFDDEQSKQPDTE